MNQKELWNFLRIFKVPTVFLIIIWTLHALKVFFGLDMFYLGIYPRDWSGLRGILFSPFIHSTISHAASNSVPLFVLLTILFYFYQKVSWNALVSIAVFTGIFVWLFARPSYHIGASGLVYGLVSFVFFTGIFKKNAKSVVLSLVVLVLYAGSVEGLFPNVAERISWESHTYGALSGLIVAFILKNVIEDDELIFQKHPSWAENEGSKQFFLPRDVFEKTKIERYYEALEAQMKQQESSEATDD